MIPFRHLPTFTAGFLLLVGQWASAQSVALSLASADSRLTDKIEKSTTPVPTGYVITLREPSVLAFEDTRQLSTRAKALNLRPTAPRSESGRFDPATTAVRAYRDYLRRRQDEVIAELAPIAGKSLAPVHRWSLVGNGFSLRIGAAEAARIAKHPDVRSVTKDSPRILDDFATPQTVGADPVWFGGLPGVLASKGEGVVVGVIDTGIHAGHPAFAEVASDGYRHQNPRDQRFGLCRTTAAALCNNKLIGIYDFGAPFAAAPGGDESGHGTAVASRVVGNPVASALAGPTTSLATTFSGVAPRANLIFYRAVGNGFGPEMAALDQVVLDRVDVLNMSFGFDTDETPWEHPFAEALLQARAAGIVPIVSTGNLGPDRATVKRSPAYSPWTTSVAANRMNTSVRTRLADINGFGITQPFTLSGEGITAGLPEAELVLATAVTPNNNLCASGPSGSTTNPFPAGSLTGKIVVCFLGNYTLVAKSQNAKAAGAVGIVVIGHPNSGPQTFPQPMLLPGVNLNSLDGARLFALMIAAQGQGQAIRARIEGADFAASPITGLLADYSSRGPVPQYGGVLKPNVAAPGPETWAAASGGSGYIGFAGTSSAAPAAAGVAALLRAVHPSWTVDQITSAMATTGTHGTYYQGNDVTVSAGPLEDGGGMVNAGAAARAGLSFAVATSEFQAADPAIGGNPEQLNLPGIYTRRCLEACSFTRKVTANVGGTWQAVTAMDNPGFVTVIPSQLALAAGQTAEVTIHVQFPPDLAAGTRVDGEVRFVSGTPDQVPLTRVPITIEIGVGDLGRFDLGSRPTHGGQDAQTDRLADLPEVALATWPLRSIAGRNEFLGDGERRNFFLGAPAGVAGRSGVAGKIFLHLTSATAPDVDLVLHEDTNGDGFSDGVLCASLSLTSDERCEIDSVWNPGKRYFYEVQSYAGSAGGDSVSIAVYNEVLAADPSLVATALRGRNAADTSLPFRLHWDMTAVPVGAEALGYVSVVRDGVSLGTGQVTMVRAASDLPAIVMSAKSDRKVIELEPGQAHERIVVDVPPNQTALVLRADGVGGNVDLFVSKANGAPTPPTFAAAPPRTQQPFVSAGPSNSETIGLEGGTFGPGRYYVTPVNAGSTRATVTLTTTGLYSGTTLQPSANGYFNPSRSGHGVFLARTPQVWALAWYTFDAAGKPIWYTAQGAAAAANDGLWSAPIYRSTWNGVRDNPQEVGKVILTFDGTGSFTYSWFLDGQYGSEQFVPIGAPQCANGNLSVGGGWLRLDQPGWGSYFLNFPGNFEAEAVYVYDADGLPRWVIGDGTYATTLQKNLFQVQGFCPTCAAIPTTRTQVGMASRTLASASTGTFSSNITFADGLSGTWVQNNVQWAKLTPNLACP